MALISHVKLNGLIHCMRQTPRGRDMLIKEGNQMNRNEGFTE